MTPAEREALRALAAKATPGPWYTNDSADCGWQVVTGNGYEVFDDGSAGNEYRQVASDADRAYVIAACNALPALLSALSDAEAERDRLRKLLPPDVERCSRAVGEGSWSVFAEKVVAERDRLRAENDDLRARLARLEAVAEAARACVRPMLQYHAARVGDCPGCVARRVLEQRLRILDGGDK